MKKICEHCIHNACSYKTRGLENKCEKVQDYEQGYADAVEKACEWIGQQQEMLEDCFSDVNDFADLLKEAMEEEQ